jgi:uncharacterized repeat protein (TIGR03843 family)
VSTRRTSAGQAGVLELLHHGTLEVEGRLVAASNATLYASVTLDGRAEHCVYKPVAGERPLWDFPDGTLSHREVAAYEVSAATGWDVVPPTVWRDGPFGPGSVQLWIEEVGEPALVDVVPLAPVPAGWRVVLEAHDGAGDPVLLVHADDPRLQRMAVLDAVIDNADRKGGHILLAPDGRVHGVDHGVCFNVDPKLRTILWGWAGEPLPQEYLEVLRRLDSDLDSGDLDSGDLDGGDRRSGATGTSRPDRLAARLRQHLTAGEIARTRQRVQQLMRAGRFPRPPAHGPRIPWPPF